MIIETQEQFDSFYSRYINHSSILIPILIDGNSHPANTPLSLMYIKIIGGNDYILPFNHSEAQNLSIDYLYELNTPDIKYTYDKKKLNHIVKLNNVVDVNLIYYLKNNIPLDITDIDLPIYRYFMNTFYHKKNLNRIIPILKHLEYCRTLAKVLRFEKDTPSIIYNNDIIDILTHIESSGLQYNDKIIYSEYNMFTITGRPSNRFGGINFAALNKTDGSRKPFISRFGNRGMLVEFDYNSFHLRLIGDVIGYKFPPGSVHEYFGKQYGIDDYEKSKTRSFKYLYGNIPTEIADSIPYFKQVDEYITMLWNTYKKTDFIESYTYSKKIYKKNLRDMTKNKLFNYTLQLMEFEHGIKVLREFIPVLEKYKSKLILYSYDSFLLDFHLDDGVECLRNIKELIEQDGKYPTKVSCGINYHKMKDITRKFKL